MNNKKMKNVYINRDNDEDLKLRYIDKFLNRFQSVLNNRIQIDIFIKHISHNNSLYKIKHDIESKKYVFRKIIDNRAILYLY